jgi:hypothetical protein
MSKKNGFDELYKSLLYADRCRYLEKKNQQIFDDMQKRVQETKGEMQTNTLANSHEKDK